MTVSILLAAITATQAPRPQPAQPPVIVAPPPIIMPYIPPPPAVSTSGWPSERAGPVLSSPNWSDYHNYPMAAASGDQEGLVGFILLVDEFGKPAQCAIRSSSGYAALDGGTCALAMQMRFEPARNANGRAITSTYSTRVFWLLDDARAFASSSLDADLKFSDGTLLGCVAQGSGPYVQPWKQLVCRDATIYPKKLATYGGIPDKVVLAIRLDAGDGLANSNWPEGKVLARDYATFGIDSDGDATDCSMESDGDIFSNDYRSQSPCGHFLATIWFEKPEEKKVARGVFELRLIAPAEHSPR